MRGLNYSSDGSLPEQDLLELADLLACQLFERMGPKVALLSRRDVAELVEPYIDDLSEHDRRTVPWLVWDLFQEGSDGDWAEG
jgi:hypothetical protein